MRDQLEWFFMEWVSQLDPDDLYEKDFEEAVAHFEKFRLNGIKMPFDEHEVRAMWDRAVFCVANP